MDYLDKYSFLEAFGGSRASREAHGLVEDGVKAGCEQGLDNPSVQDRAASLPFHLHLDACFIPIRCLF